MLNSVDGFKCSLKKWRSKENALGMHELLFGFVDEKCGVRLYRPSSFKEVSSRRVGVTSAISVMWSSVMSGGLNVIESSE